MTEADSSTLLKMIQKEELMIKSLEKRLEQHRLNLDLYKREYESHEDIKEL